MSHEVASLQDLARTYVKTCTFRVVTVTVIAIVLQNVVGPQPAMLQLLLFFYGSMILQLNYQPGNHRITDLWIEIVECPTLQPNKYVGVDLVMSVTLINQ